MQGLRCRACAEACRVSAIRFRTFAGGYAHPEVDLAGCDGCGVCLEACPLRCATEAVA
ncbi:MAG: 4Fe-4S dicluster domain-containing protein [Kiloniellales bacterium]|nr:4Fe-4S dicluster domain-containing protein [Kiloniellales bacterium]MDJ0968529.1 4Fe-4S dicluster domain-containing protein [Kiloniellales bacterium]MDJ0980453.1 4Fe-4S dicluster domain-containing protein [Kiloniellales bacterium]